ncbi:MAG TPA: L,D-transpeptidase family protein [Patescibacteria group bacterium]|nr:L,D-transpeptidase family protein [Patescibacteria group bacterium]
MNTRLLALTGLIGAGLIIGSAAQAAENSGATIKPAHHRHHHGKKTAGMGPFQPASATAFDGIAIGETKHYKAKYEDTMVALARANDVGYVELLAANPGVDPWLPGRDTDMIIPKMHILPIDAPHEGIVINLPEMRLFYYPRSGGKPYSFPIGIGREGLQTPVGQTNVRSKAKDFDWRPTPRMRAEDPTLPEVVGPGDDNPMGKYVLYLGWAEYGIHGTNKPYGIGRRSSSGCIRLYPEDIEFLWPQVPTGTKVTVVNQPIKAAWIGSKLYVEAHPTMAQADRMEMGAPGDAPTYEMSEQDMKFILRAAGPFAGQVDWVKVRQIVKERRGYPISVATRPEQATVTQAADKSADEPKNEAKVEPAADSGVDTAPAADEKDSDQSL